MRHHSAEILSADLDDHDNCISLIEKAIKIWGRLDVLINNASTFAASPVGKTDMATWNALLNSNLKAPFFLAQAASFYLKKTRGSIVNITDIHAHQPMKNYPVYSCAKAGLSMLTKALALELAPRVRVNAVAPGNVLWPEGKNSYSQTKKRKILSATLLKKQIDPKDIAETVLFLIHNASITGQTIVVGSDRK